MKVRAPRSALEAYQKALSADRAVSLVGKHCDVSLPTWNNDTLLEVVHGTERNLASFGRWLERCRVTERDALAVLRVVTDARDAYRLPDVDLVANAFWNHGIRGWEPPVEVLAWRYGDIPDGGRSFNYRDRYLEDGVSVAAIVETSTVKAKGAGRAFGMFFGDRPVRWVRGWWREDVTGSDGEPLIVGARRARAPR